MTATVILSIVALALSVASLSWQAWAWSRNGPRLRMGVSRIQVTYGEDLTLQLTIANAGRAAATVVDVRVQLIDGGRHRVTVVDQGLPAGIEPYASAVLWAGFEPPEASSVPVEAWATTATRKVIKTRTTLDLKPFDLG